MEPPEAPRRPEGKRPADDTAPQEALSSPQTAVLGDVDLVSHIVPFTMSRGDFKALVRACVRPAARPGFKASFGEWWRPWPGNEVAAMVNETLLGRLDKWVVEMAEGGEVVREEDTRKLRSGIACLACALRILGNAAASAGSVKEVRHCLPPKDFAQAYTAVHDARKVAGLDAAVYTAFRTGIHTLADAMLHPREASLGTKWAHYTQAVNRIRDIGAYMERHYARHNSLPDLVHLGLNSGAMVLRARFSAEVIEAEGLTQVVAEHARPVWA